MGNREMEKEIKIRLTDELHARVKRVAQTNGQNITALVRFYIVQGLQTDEEKIHRFTEIGRGGGKKSPPKSKFLTRDHPRRIIDFEEAKKSLSNDK